MRVRNWVLAVWVAALALPASANLCPQELRRILTQAEDPNFKAFAGLPLKDSAAFKQLSQSLLTQIHSAKGYAILDLSAFVSENEGLLWYHSLPNPAQIIAPDRLSKLSGSDKSATLKAWQIQGITSFEAWVRDLLTQNLKDFLPPRKDPSLSIRVSTSKGDGIKVGSWHMDGGHVAALFSMHGLGTEILGPGPVLTDYATLDSQATGSLLQALYCANCEPFTLGRGQMLIFFGTDAAVKNRVAPLIHRSPHERRESVLFLNRY